MSETATTADAIARTLTDYPDGITTRDLAKAAGVGQTTAQTALTAMEAAGTARRTPGTGDGRRRTPDVWRPIVTDTGTDDTTPDAITDDAPAAPDDTTDNTLDTTTDEATDAPDTTDAVVPVSGVPVAAPASAPVSMPAPPVPVTPRQPDLKVLIMAGVLGNHPDGVSAHDAINESGLAAGVADTILLAMEVVGAARRLPAGDDGSEPWVRGDGDLSAVDPANAPTHVTCPTCGHVRPIRRAAAGPRRTRTGRPAPEINSDGSDRLGKNGLRDRVEAFMRDLGTGHDVTPGTVARELGRSSGAVGNAMDKLTEVGVLALTNEAPRMFALVETAPAPTAMVTTLMRRPLITTGTESTAR